MTVKKYYFVIDAYGFECGDALEQLTTEVEKIMNEENATPVGGISITQIQNPDGESVFLVAQAMTMTNG